MFTTLINVSVKVFDKYTTVLRDSANDDFFNEPTAFVGTNGCPENRIRLRLRQKISDLEWLPHHRELGQCETNFVELLWVKCSNIEFLS